MKKSGIKTCFIVRFIVIFINMVGRVIVLLLLIAVLLAGGIIWFDYLTIIDAKTVLAPFYRLVGREGRTQPRTGPDDELNLDAERLNMRLAALALEKSEMETLQRDLDTRHNLLMQMSQDLDEKEKAIAEREFYLQKQQQDAENRDRNIEANARFLTGMPPDRAVGILSAMDDQDVIDILRKTEEIAKAEDASSIVPFWLSLMDSNRAAELQRKMANRPHSL